jgi:hypothetical protein
VLLHANDFGCVPDGRFLERTSIAENSALLTDRDGRLRPTDVGKNVAIPGAGDLVTTIARLIERREVRNAAMDAAGAQPHRLSGTLFDPEQPTGSDEEPFQARLHAGRRITVAGAGPNGSTLVTDIVKVIDATTVELATPAATSVLPSFLTAPTASHWATMPAAALSTSPPISAIAPSPTARSRSAEAGSPAPRRAPPHWILASKSRCGRPVCLSRPSSPSLTTSR